MLGASHMDFMVDYGDGSSPFPPDEIIEERLTAAFGGPPAREWHEMRDWSSLRPNLSSTATETKTTRVLQSTVEDGWEQDLASLLRAGTHFTRREIDVVWRKLEAQTEERYEKLRSEFYLNYVLGASSPPRTD